ncbi:hypothetical protein Dimus_011134 [Dionaea muscipula]
MFPLLLLLDAAIECRASPKADTEGIIELTGIQTPHRVSDTIAETGILCLEELLTKCGLVSLDQVGLLSILITMPLTSESGMEIFGIAGFAAFSGCLSDIAFWQMNILLKKLTYAAMIQPTDASEEFREGAIRCFRALLLNLRPCFDKSCSCSQSFDFPELLDGRFEVPPVRDMDDRPPSDKCLIAFLQSQSASVVIGHWLSLLLNAADAEAGRGHRGSAKIRVEAFLTLRTLVAKVGTADALAFFLPGTVSQLAKVLHASRLMSSGAAGSTDASDHAIRGLAEYLMIVLHDDANLSDYHPSCGGITDFQSNESGTAETFLYNLRLLETKIQNQTESHADESSVETVADFGSQHSLEERTDVTGGTRASLHVNRTHDWLEKTSTHVDKLLCRTFRNMCVHPAKKLRQAILAAIQGLLLKCSYTLKRSRLMFLECLYVLVCDDSEDISKSAQECLEILLSSDGQHNLLDDILGILDRLLEKLPKVVLGNDESFALAHTQQLLAGMYYSGPHLVTDNFLNSSIKAARVFEIFSICLSHESAFAGSLDKIIFPRPRSSGYLHSITELKSGCRSTVDGPAALSSITHDIMTEHAAAKEVSYSIEMDSKDYDLPRMPPWFMKIGSLRVYQGLSRIVRLLGLSLIADCRSEVSLPRILEIPLGHLRKLISEIRMKEYNNESWQTWYARTGFGKQLRQASTAVCILNEMIFGMSDNAADVFSKIFNKSTDQPEDVQEHGADASIKLQKVGSRIRNKPNWQGCHKRGVMPQMVECIGIILHEYTSPEFWDLPVEHKLSLIEADAAHIDKHFFHDVVMLQQEITLSPLSDSHIGRNCRLLDQFASRFLRSSVYLLLENLICSNFEVRHAADAVLRILSSVSGYLQVGHLVVGNADYIIDSFSRQLRHLDLNPHIPNVLAAMLSYIGVANKILPLLEEPMRTVSLELEILGRHRHPELTMPFLKAVAEIVKAAKHEATLLPAQAESLRHHVEAKAVDVRKHGKTDKKLGKDCVHNSGTQEETNITAKESGDQITIGGDARVDVNEWENILFNLNDQKRYRHIVASLANSSLVSVIPLLASANGAECMIALDITEDAILTLAEVENAFKHEKGTKEAVQQVATLCSLFHLKETLDAAERGSDENRLLPAANKIWPFLVACVRNRNPMSVRRCLPVISNVVRVCGGDFFSRRFKVDGPHFWKLLTTSPFVERPNKRDAGTPLQLPYRSSKPSWEDSISEVSNLKVQAAVLNMIADISRQKRSAPALEVVLKKVSGLVVGIACSGVSGLRDASTNALLGVASMDPDLVWLLVADIYYSMRKQDVSPPISHLPELVEILPPTKCSKDYLYVQYGGQSYGFDIDFLSVEAVFKRLNSLGLDFQKLH